MTHRTRPPDSARSTSAGSVHRLGDGWHHLPVFAVTADGLHQLTSEPCVLLHLACWAHRRAFDPESIQARAAPDEGMFRSDQLLMYRMWTSTPDRLDTSTLIEDLEQINHHRLAAVLREIESGRWRPDRAFTHWVVTPDGRIAGEARDLDPAGEPDDQGQHYCYVRLYAMPEMAEWGYSDHTSLRPKSELGTVAGEPAHKHEEGGAS